MSIKRVLDWRAEKRIDDLLNEDVDGHEIYHKCWQTKYCGSDKFGHPVLLERVEDHDVTQLQRLVPLEDVSFSICWTLPRANNKEIVSG